MTIGIYAIENKINQKIYIGQSTDIHTRFLAHKSCLRRNCHKNQYLQKSWNKYGESNFDFYLIEKCSKNELNIKETEWFNFYLTKKGRNNVYNIGHTGEQKTMSDEQKQKISIAKKEFYKNHPEALKEMSIARTGKKNAMYGVSGKNHPMYGKHHTEETKQKLRNLRLGTTQSEETKHKKSITESGINNPMYGKHHTEEARLKMSLARRKRTMTLETRQKISQKTRGSIWINNGVKTSMIQPVYWKEYEENGWKKGRLKLKTKGAKKQLC